jgi:hypothetical protein
MFKPLLQFSKAVFGGQRKGPPRCVAVCLDHQVCHWAGITQSDIDFMVERLQEVLKAEQFTFDGQDQVDHETRLYFFTPTPERTVPVVLAKLREISWCRGSRVQVQTSRFGLWDTHLL